MIPGALTHDSSRKSERIEARVSADFKQMVERAAALTGHTVTSFMLYALQSSALEAMKESALITLSAKESLVVAKALLAPPVPNARLRAADARYRRLVKASA